MFKFKTPKKSWKLHTFFNYNGIIEKDVTIKHMVERYGLNHCCLQQVSQNHKLINKGWTCNKENLLKFNSRYSIFTFENVITNAIEVRTTCQKLSLSYPDHEIIPSHFSYVLNGILKHNKGWIITERFL